MINKLTKRKKVLIAVFLLFMFLFQLRLLLNYFGGTPLLVDEPAVGGTIVDSLIVEQSFFTRTVIYFVKDSPTHIEQGEYDQYVIKYSFYGYWHGRNIDISDVSEFAFANYRFQEEYGRKLVDTSEEALKRRTSWLFRSNMPTTPPHNTNINSHSFEFDEYTYVLSSYGIINKFIGHSSEETINLQKIIKQKGNILQINFASNGQLLFANVKNDTYEWYTYDVLNSTYRHIGQLPAGYTTLHPHDSNKVVILRTDKNGDDFNYLGRLEVIDLTSKQVIKSYETPTQDVKLTYTPVNPVMELIALVDGEIKTIAIID